LCGEQLVIVWGRGPGVPGEGVRAW